MCGDSSFTGLRVQGNKIVDPNGARFIIKGVNAEVYRDYKGGCGYITDDLFVNNNHNLNRMTAKMKALGINAVRLNYTDTFLNQSSQNLTNFENAMLTLASNGIYVMPSDHAQSGLNLADRARSYPTFKKIIQYAQQNGIERYLIMNPFNEPGPISWSAWVTANQDILKALRNADPASGYAGYAGLVMLDTPKWSSTNSAAHFQAITDFDAALLGGTANVGFDNHWYPNTPINYNPSVSSSYVKSALDVERTYPIAIGELGQQNPGSSKTDPQYVKDVLSLIVNTGIPEGHNGVFAWIWSWCDINSMATSESNYADLNSYGQIYVDYYWSKIP